MIGAIKKIDNGTLVILGLLPLFIYIHGYAMIGSTMFTLANPQNDKIALSSDVAPSDITPETLEEIRRNEEKLQRFNSKKESEKEKFEQAVKLSEKVHSVANIEAQQKEEVRPTVQVPVVVESKPKSVRQATNRNTNKPVQVKEAVKEEPTGDIYTQFNLQRSEFVLDNKEKQKKEVYENLPIRYIKAQFIEDKVFVVGVHNKLYLRNHESFKIESGGKHILVPENTLLLGKTYAKKTKLEIHIESINIDGLDYPTNIVVCGDDNSEGLAVQDMGAFQEDLNDEVESATKRSLNRINVNLPVIGGISLPSQIRDDKVEIFIDSSTKVKLKVQ